ncbi:MAG TPA: metallopeptidase family protein [Thermoanaerobaculia bacterium]|nr:metallopeptidase family protein [Thermoanaerobaculia bacterium]
MAVNPAEFERLVEEALDSLPDRFAELLDNVVVVVEEEPSALDLDVLNHDHGHEHTELLGIYRGTPMTRRTYDSFRMPDQIAIFRGPILRVTRNRSDAHRQIRETVIHELGHYFGLSDEEMVF